MAISFSNEIFIPVFYNLGINTTYEYLELRFCRKVRNATTIMFMVANVISTAVVIYAPATAISAVTGTLQTKCINYFLKFIPSSRLELLLTLAGKMTIYLFTFILLKMAERSEAKSAKRSFASKISFILIFDAKLRFELLASLRSAIFSDNKLTINWSLSLQGLTG